TSNMHRNELAPIGQGTVNRAGWTERWRIIGAGSWCHGLARPAAAVMCPRLIHFAHLGGRSEATGGHPQWLEQTFAHVGFPAGLGGLVNDDARGHVTGV